MTRDMANMSFIEKVEYLQSDISATMVWSYKYQILISANRMEEIEEEEKEYIDRHNANIDKEEL